MSVELSNSLPNILFVDDEPNILNALKRFTRPKHKDWNMVFVTGGQEAIAVLQQQPFQVVVSDMRMPMISGAELLEWISQNMPGVVRLVLSGESNLQETYRVVGRSHRFLAKPCDAESLIKAIEGALSACTNEYCYLPGPSASFLDRLTTPIELLEKLNNSLKIEEDANSSIEHVADLISSDPSLSARTLQLVNSAYFGRPQSTLDICKAVKIMGIERLRDLLARGRMGNGRTGTINTQSQIDAKKLATLAKALGTNEAEKALFYCAGLFVNLANVNSPSSTHASAAKQTTLWACAPYASELLGLPDPLSNLMRLLSEAARDDMDEDGLASLIASTFKSSCDPQNSIEREAVHAR
jgi:CheY-like chemotaxis protein